MDTVPGAYLIVNVFPNFLRKTVTPIIMNLNYFGNRFKLYIIALGKSATSYPLIDTLYYGLITFGYIRQLFNIHARGKTLNT